MSVYPYASNLKPKNTETCLGSYRFHKSVHLICRYSKVENVYNLDKMERYYPTHMNILMSSLNFFNLLDSCTIEKQRGPCRNYTVKWFYDMEYGGCSRFWYGGCEGNGNRFKSKEECTGVCVEPTGTDRCRLPKVPGPCEGYYPQWYYDKDRKQCAQFIYRGCLGNNNRFETKEECAELCVSDSSVGMGLKALLNKPKLSTKNKQGFDFETWLNFSGAVNTRRLCKWPCPDQIIKHGFYHIFAVLDACEQKREEGPCHGSYPRWYFDKESQTCQQFVYGGCKANNNNFPTDAACKQQCAQPGRKKGKMIRNYSMTVLFLRWLVCFTVL